MAVRQFNGTSDFLRCDNGTIGQLGNGALTILALVKSTTVNAGECYIAAEIPSPGASTIAGLFDNGTNSMALADDDDYCAATVTHVASVWEILAVTCAGPGNAPRLHRKALGSGSWEHANSGTSFAGNTGTATAVEFGSFDNGAFSSFKDCRLATGAIWNSVLSDGDIESIDTTPATQTIYDLTPLSLWDFNQTDVATDVLDLMENGADEISISGTTVINGDDPPGWTFGLAPPPVTGALPIPVRHLGRGAGW